MTAVQRNVVSWLCVPNVHCCLRRSCISSFLLNNNETKICIIRIHIWEKLWVRHLSYYCYCHCCSLLLLLVSNKHSCKFVSLKPFSACTQLIYFSPLSQNGFIVWNFNAFFLFQPTDSLSNSVTKIAICSFNLFKNSKKKLPFDNFAFTFNVHSIHCYLAICFRL